VCLNPNLTLTYKHTPKVFNCVLNIEGGGGLPQKLNIWILSLYLCRAYIELIRQSPWICCLIIGKDYNIKLLAHTVCQQLFSSGPHKLYVTCYASQSCSSHGCAIGYEAPSVVHHKLYGFYQLGLRQPREWLVAMWTISNMAKIIPYPTRRSLCNYHSKRIMAQWPFCSSWLCSN